MLFRSQIKAESNRRIRRYRKISWSARLSAICYTLVVTVIMPSPDVHRDVGILLILSSIIGIFTSYSLSKYAENQISEELMGQQTVQNYYDSLPEEER